MITSLKVFKILYEIGMNQVNNDEDSRRDILRFYNYHDQDDILEVSCIELLHVLEDSPGCLKIHFDYKPHYGFVYLILTPIRSIQESKNLPRCEYPAKHSWETISVSRPKWLDVEV